jgi:Raf kinase inhibitor-like YbhB/YbcL family protein
MQDMDVARNGTTDTQLHWLVWNIPADARTLLEGLPRGATLPNGAYQVSATGPVYRGPGAPANGPPHHYLFEIYALDTVIAENPGEDAFETRERVLAAAQGHILGKASYLGLFRRPE